MAHVRFSNYPTRYNTYNDELFNSLFNWNNKVVNHKSSMPSVNIKENEDGFILEMAAPGMSKEDLKLELDHDVLTISAEINEEQEEQKDNFSRREFCQSSFSRAFTLPESTKNEDIKARYENGILEVTIPKKEEAKPQAKMEIAIS